MEFKINKFLLNKLPVEIVNYILFISSPRMSDKIKKELKLEAAHMMCKIHYEWWYPKLVKYWHLNDIEDMSELPLKYTYNYTLLHSYDQDRIIFIMKQLFNCGCCKRHSQGILDKPHCLHIRKNMSLREKRDTNNYKLSINTMFQESRYNSKNNICSCNCRHILRNIYKSIKSID